MRAVRLHRQVFVHLALWVMVLGALAPTVSRWLVSVSPERALLELCAGRAGVGLASPLTSPEDGPAMATLDHCPLCTLDQHHPGLPPVAGLPSFVAAPRDEAPTLFLQAPRPLHPWAAVRSRGPPVHAQA